MLDAVVPMAIYWGPQYILLYNDAWAKLIGDKHPDALGQPARVVFPEIWSEIEPLFVRALAGEGTQLQDQHFHLSRAGPIEDAWFTVSLNPLRDAAGTVHGFLNIAAETTTRVQAERTLRDSEEFYRLATQAARIGTWDVDLDTGETRLSPMMGELLEAPPGALISRDVWERAVPMADRQRVEHAITQTAQTGERFEVEFRVLRNDGSERWLHAWDSGIHVSQSGERRIFGATIDVTARREAEQDAQRSQVELAEIFRRATVGLSEIDAAGTFARVNDELCRLLGRSREDLLQRSILDVTHPEDQSASLAAAAAVLESGEPRSLDKRYVRPDGSVFWAQSSLARIDAFGAEAARILAVTIDLTSRHEAEAIMRENEERYRALVSNLPGGAAFTLDRELRFITAEGEALRLAGCSPADFIGRTVADVFGGTVANVLVPRLERALQGESFELEHPLYDRQFLSRGVPLHQPDESLAILVCSFDITQRVEAERALRIADRQKDEFLATLAHELRNPLAPLRNCVHLLKRTPCDPAALPSLDMMERQVSHLQRLVSDLMDLGRITAGKIELRQQPVDLNDLLRSIAERSRHIIESHGHSLDVQLNDESVVTLGDPDRLAQIFSNLLNNAAKYTERGGRITLSLSCTPSEVIVRVADTGIGIPPSALHHVFDLFSQVKDHQTRAEGGLGVGLSLVRTLAILHGGSVSAHSEGSGKGSVFSVRLPRLMSEAAPASPTLPTTEGQGDGVFRVLIADDDIDAAISLAAIIEAEGHEVTVSHDGVDALRKAREFQPAIVILNLNMPLMNGIDAGRRIRRLPGMRDVRLFALTGRGSDADRRETRAAGFGQHLVKPVEPARLLALLRSEGTRAR
jgi:PAS domain S-box-containing protein